MIPLPGSNAPIEDLDAPAYTRGLTSLRDVQGNQAIRASDRVDASNRSFNQQFWATLSSEAGGVPTGIDATRLGTWVAELWGSWKAGDVPPDREDRHKW